MSDHYLPVETGGALYAIPLVSVLSVQTLSLEEPLLSRQLSRAQLPALDLSNLFEAASPAQTRIAVMVHDNGSRVVLLVEAVQPPRSKLRWYSLPTALLGAGGLFQGMLLDNQSLIPVLDPKRMIALILQASVMHARITIE